MPTAEKLAYEKELLGFYISGHPMDSYAGLDLAINTFNQPDQLADAICCARLHRFFHAQILPKCCNSSSGGKGFLSEEFAVF